MSLLKLVSAVTGVLLAPLAVLAALTGACLKSPLVVEELSMGLLSYGFCSYAHSAALPVPLTVLAVLHAVAATRSLADSVPREERLARLVLEVYWLAVLVVGAYALALVIASSL